MTPLRIIALAFNIAMILWFFYETMVVAGRFGPAPGHFPMGKNFVLMLISVFWLAGNAFWGLIELIIFLRRR
ncbi:hypothetical protein [Lentibacter sp. XHP0401]|jgi:hypothetical protein|uniref:hypothetical protein n=1 Tax=Lentibacter sp. XHP0401 TaxID=2984334 RepID=UPI0021E99E81|nr:hypothetical protein [Lentibacter sp. XHP0401]MCV2893222.1 hypothetical protein [Lentibacter sp. XHP0401]